MENRFLPIGSVCTLKGKNKKVMITGYYGVEFNGNLKFDDYQGCAYPEGMLLPEFTCNFNHSDIVQVDFIGYKNDEQKRFNNLLDRLTGNNIEDNEYKNEEWSLVSNNSYSKLLFDENGVVVLAEPVVKEKKVDNQIKFDENGIVIEDSNSKVGNPFYKEYNEDSSAKDNSASDIFSKYEFDENGVVLNVKEVGLDEKKLNKIEFDENGIVIAVNEEKPKEQYKFDENGILIEVVENESSQIEPEYVKSDNKKVSNYSFDENGNLVSEHTYEFDNDGNLVSLNETKLEQEEIPTLESEVTDNIESKKEPKYKFDEYGNVISE